MASNFWNKKKAREARMAERAAVLKMSVSTLDHLYEWSSTRTAINSLLQEWGHSTDRTPYWSTKVSVQRRLQSAARKRRS